MTKITIEQEDAIVTRTIHAIDEDEFETWPELVPAFFQMLTGLGYTLSADSYTLTSAVEEANDKASKDKE